MTSMPDTRLSALLRRHGIDAGLLWLRLTSSVLLFLTNGWPKIAHYSDELAHIDDPLNIGRGLTLWMALGAEVLCPAMVAVGWFTRSACLPILVLLLVALLLVHPDWSLGQGQFGWLYVIVYASLGLAGPGRWSADVSWAQPGRPADPTLGP
jgi:putative oxidoreductase